MKRGIQGIPRGQQPKQPITKSVARDTIWEYLGFIHKYNLFFSAIIWGGLIGEANAFTDTEVY